MFDKLDDAKVMKEKSKKKLETIIKKQFKNDVTQVVRDIKYYTTNGCNTVDSIIRKINYKVIAKSLRAKSYSVRKSSKKSYGKMNLRMTIRW